MWQDLVDQQDKWIGGKLIDRGDSMERAMFKPGALPKRTTITGFRLTDDYFEVEGKRFNCGGARSVLGVSPEHVKSGLVLKGYGGHVFVIVKP